MERFFNALLSVISIVLGVIYSSEILIILALLLALYIGITYRLDRLEKMINKEEDNSDSEKTCQINNKEKGYNPDSY